VRSEVRHNIDLPADNFTIPAALRVAANAADAARGEQMAQWFLRRQVIGFPS